MRGVSSLKIVVVTGVEQSKEGELPQKGDYRSVSMLSGKTILSVTLDTPSRSPYEKQEQKRADTHSESRDEAKVKPRFAPRGEKLGKTRRREVLSKVCVVTSRVGRWDCSMQC